MTRPLTALFALLMIASFARAESLALVPGRLATPTALPDKSLELGYIAYEDGSLIGGRFNYRFDERTILYADFGRAEFDFDLDGGGDLEGSGQAFGAGVFRFLPDAVENYDVSLRASYHQGRIESDDVLNVRVERPDGSIATTSGTIEDESQTEYSADVIVSGREPLAENGLRWYASVGYHVLKFDQEFAIQGAAQRIDIGDDSSGIGFGVGLVLPLERGQAYAGYESIDGEAQYGAGFRYFFGS